MGGSSYVKYCFIRFTCIEPFSTAVSVKGVGWILVEGFVVSCVKSWFINCTGFISVGRSGNEVSTELSCE